MIPITCRTNLDLFCEIWPKELPAVPAVGQTIQSKTVWKENFQLELKVVAVSWKSSRNGWYCEVELHMTDWQERIIPSDRSAAQGSTTAFYEWYATKVGKRVSFFI